MDRLVRFRAWLDRELRCPFEVRVLGPNLRQVTVLSSVTIEVDSASRTVQARSAAATRLRPAALAFEVYRALESPQFLRCALRVCEQTPGEPVAAGFPPAAARKGESWILAAALGGLRTNQRFRRLQRGLPELLQIPPQILRLAMTSRSQPQARRLSVDALNAVWQESRAFALVEREHPHLLPLLLALCLDPQQQSRIEQADPIRTLKERLRAAGLTEACWRYLTRNGARAIRTAWQLAGRERQAWRVAVAWLRMLDDAGLPPFPPAVIARAFARAYSGHLGERVDIRDGFHAEVPKAVLRATMLEADRRRSADRLRGFERECLGVMAWAARQVAPMDSNLAKAGWSAYVRRWREDEVLTARLANVRHRFWSCSVHSFNVAAVTVVPIESGHDLVIEARALHNCLHEFVDRCAAGDVEIYSVRDALSGERLGCVGLRCLPGYAPELIDVRGFANQPAGASLRMAGQAVMARVVTA